MKRLAWMPLAVALGFAVLAPAGVAEDESGTVGVELRVWQRVSEPLQVFLSARPEAGRWGPTERLPMAQTNARGTFRYSDRTIDVPAGGGVGRVPRPRPFSQPQSTPYYTKWTCPPVSPTGA